jgi:hypothetical protein
MRYITSSLTFKDQRLNKVHPLNLTIGLLNNVKIVLQLRNPQNVKTNPGKRILVHGTMLKINAASKQTNSN